MEGTSEDPQGAVERWWAAVADGDWWSIVILAAAFIVPLLLKVLFEQMAKRLPGEPAGLGLGRRWLRFRSVLQPSRYVSVDFVYEVGRMPLDPRLKFTGRLGVLRRLFFLGIRPSSPKPAFLVSSLEVLDSVDVQGTGARNKRIFIRVHPNENPQHLANSLDAGRVRPLRTLLVCPIEAFLDSGGPFEVFFVDRRFTKRATDDLGTVVAFSADPLFAQRQRNEIIESGEPPDDAIWLFLFDPCSATGGGGPDRGVDEVSAETSQCSQGAEELVCAASGNEAVDRAAGEPWGGMRWGRYLAITAPLVSGALLLWSMLDHSWATELPDLALIGVLLVLELLAWVGLSMLALSCVRYFRFERNFGNQWTATTINCLVDGRRFRRGHRDGIKPDDRYRTRRHPN